MLYSKQPPLMKYDAENLSAYRGIPRTHFLEVFISRAYRSRKQFRYFRITQARHTVIERKSHVFRKVQGSHDLICVRIVLFFACLMFIYGFRLLFREFKALTFAKVSVVSCQYSRDNEITFYFYRSRLASFGDIQDVVQILSVMTA